LIAAHLLFPDVRLALSFGSGYTRTELDALRVLDNKYNIPGTLREDYSLDWMGAYERSDYIVPNRNAHAVLVASAYGNTIILGAISGDRSYDKDDNFCAHMTDLLNHTWQQQHWCEGRTYSVEIPLKSKTKTELVKEFLALGHGADMLLDSYSCYTPSAQHCGQCKPCVRKWVALRCNGVDIPSTYFETFPGSVAWFVDTAQSIERGNVYRGREDEHIVAAYRTTI